MSEYILFTKKKCGATMRSEVNRQKIKRKPLYFLSMVATRAQKYTGTHAHRDPIMLHFSGKR